MRIRLWPTALLLGAISLIPDPPLRASNCINPVTAVATTDWHTITPPKEEVEVVYVAPIGCWAKPHLLDPAAAEAQKTELDSVDDAAGCYRLSIQARASGACK
jgi:hypothetical protein